MRRAVTRAGILGGLVAGLLDISEPILFYGLRGIAPIRILQSVASGLLGPAAFRGGAPTAVLGLALHFFIATTAAFVYVLASLRLPVLVRRLILCGAAYGLVVYTVMQYIVLPLSAATSGHGGSLLFFANAIFAHVFCVGLPIALCTRAVLGRAPAGS